MSETQKQSLQESILEILRNLTSPRAKAHVLLFAFFPHADCHFFFPDRMHEVVTVSLGSGVDMAPMGQKSDLWQVRKVLAITVVWGLLKEFRTHTALQYSRGADMSWEGGPL